MKLLPPDQSQRIKQLEKALHEINTLRSSTLNYAVARVIACKALGIEHTQSSEPPSCFYTDETAKEASARAISDHNQITQQSAKITELEAQNKMMREALEGLVQVVSGVDFEEGFKGEILESRAMIIASRCNHANSVLAKVKK